MSNGYLWKKHRKFTLSYLRHFGEGQRSLEDYIKVECDFLCEAFKEEQGKLNALDAAGSRNVHVRDVRISCIFPPML